ncbi:hypothetical protein K4F52_007177 [Lecanicillium sp. MT-2017a]|nr:hypothetical protein K4F52_007177 [Lecanicillium sp. MT-2017a]
MIDSSITIRKASSHDAAVVQALVESAYRGDTSRKGWTTEADFFKSGRISVEDVRIKINDPDGAVLMAYDKAGDLIACCEIVKRGDSRAYFGLFAVDPHRQGGGVGKFVLQQGERYARQDLGCQKLEMQVIALRDELISYYERRGYRRTGESRPFPYDLVGPESILRDDLSFAVLVKDLE